MYNFGKKKKLFLSHLVNKLGCWKLEHFFIFYIISHEMNFMNDAIIPTSFILLHAGTFALRQFLKDKRLQSNLFNDIDLFNFSG